MSQKDSNKRILRLNQLGGSLLLLCLLAGANAGYAQEESAVLDGLDLPPGVKAGATALPSTLSGGRSPASVPVGGQMIFQVQLANSAAVQKVELLFPDANVSEAMDKVGADTWRKVRTMSGAGSNRPYQIRIIAANGQQVAGGSGVYSVLQAAAPAPAPTPAPVAQLPSPAGVSANPQAVPLNGQIAFETRINNPASVQKVELLFPDANVSEIMDKVGADTWRKVRTMAGAGNNRPYQIRITATNGQQIAGGGGAYSVNSVAPITPPVVSHPGVPAPGALQAWQQTIVNFANEQVGRPWRCYPNDNPAGTYITSCYNFARTAAGQPSHGASAWAAFTALKSAGKASTGAFESAPIGSIIFYKIGIYGHAVIKVSATEVVGHGNELNWPRNCPPISKVLHSSLGKAHYAGYFASGGGATGFAVNPNEILPEERVSRMRFLQDLVARIPAAAAQPGGIEQKAAALGVIQGAPLSSPQNAITRYEVGVMILRAIRATNPGALSGLSAVQPFADAFANPEQRNETALMRARGLFVGQHDENDGKTYFNPDKQLSDDELAVVLNRAAPFFGKSGIVPVAPLPPVPATGPAPQPAGSIAASNALLEKYARQAGIPPMIVKAIAYQESSWQHLSAGRPKPSYDNSSFGIMQVKGLSAAGEEENIRAGVEQLDTKWKLNVSSGARDAIRKLGGIEEDFDKNILENWFFPIAAYYGIQHLSGGVPGSQLADSYTRSVFSIVANPATAMNFVSPDRSPDSTGRARSVAPDVARYLQPQVAISSPNIIPGFVGGTVQHIQAYSICQIARAGGRVHRYRPDNSQVDDITAQITQKCRGEGAGSVVADMSPEFNAAEYSPSAVEVGGTMRFSAQTSAPVTKVELVFDNLQSGPRLPMQGSGTSWSLMHAMSQSGNRQFWFVATSSSGRSAQRGPLNLLVTVAGVPTPALPQTSVAQPAPLPVQQTSPLPATDLTSQTMPQPAPAPLPAPALVQTDVSIGVSNPAPSLGSRVEVNLLGTLSDGSPSDIYLYMKKADTGAIAFWHGRQFNDMPKPWRAGVVGPNLPESNPIFSFDVKQSGNYAAGVLVVPAGSPFSLSTARELALTVQ